MQYIKDFIGTREYGKKIITIEYPLSEVNKKYLQNIDLLYIEMCFKKAEQEYLKNVKSRLDSYIKSYLPIYEQTNFENTLNNNSGMEQYIMKEGQCKKVTIIKNFNRKEIKCITHKYIEIILNEDNLI